MIELPRRGKVVVSALCADFEPQARLYNLNSNASKGVKP